MESKILKKLLAIVMIIMLTATDFFMLGSNLVSYAIELNNSTNNKNIEFSTYFKNQKGEIVDILEEVINKEDLKLYAEIKVKEEGYFNGTIELEESNFNFKNVTSNMVSSVEGNKLTLNQINAGETVEIELPIQPIVEEEIELSKLDMVSTIKLTGTYMENTYKGLNIKAEKEVNLKLVVDQENTQAELNSEIITNKIYSINGENKRVVQLLVKSKLANSNYPIKQTTITTVVPRFSEQLPEEVNVLAIGTRATNGLEENILAENWTSDDEKVQITIENKVDENNQIAWKKNVTDEFIITFIYKEDVDTSKIEMKTDSEITVYSTEDKFEDEHETMIENQELDNIVMSEIQLENSSLYKGQLYVNTKIEDKKEVEFNTITKINVRSTEIADKIIVKEENDVFATDNVDLEANTRYIRTRINKDNMIKLLGEDGFVEIKDGNSTNKITKDSGTDENGNIIVNYYGNTTEIEISTSKPVNEGILEVTHTKVIATNSYTIEQLKTITELKLRNTLTALSGETEVVNNSTEQSIQMKETTSNVELTVNKERLSTMAVNKDVMIGLKFNTYDTKYNLYKNPKITIQLPDSIEEITVNSFDKLYGDEFKIVKAVYNKANRTIEIELSGEQLNFAESEVTQLYLQLNVDMKLNLTSPSKRDKIIATYTNENDINTTEVNVVEKEIGIASLRGLVTINDIETYGIQSIAGASEDKQLVNINKRTDGGKDIIYRMSLVNNTGSAINNVRVLGNLPTDGEILRNDEKITNTLASTLKGTINAQNCTIYYSNNVNATDDISNPTNGWNANLNEVQNPKVYLIVIENMETATVFDATYTITLPQTLDYDMTTYSGYQVSYVQNTTNSTEQVKSTLVGLSTGEGIKLDTNVTAIVGKEDLTNEARVKNGEVIKYKVTTKNNGTQTMENITVKSQVPEGTVLVEPEEDYVYSGLSYYDEKTDIKEIIKTIPRLDPGQEYTYEYEVRVNMDTSEGTQVSNKAILTCGEYEKDSNTLTNLIAKSQTRVTIKRALDESGRLTPNSMMNYAIFVENLSNETVRNLSIDLQLEGQKIINMTDNNGNKLSDINTIYIDEILANGVAWIRLYTKVVEENVDQIVATVSVTDSNGNVIKSNKDIQKVETIGAKISMSSQTEGEYIEDGDEVIYNISLTNTGSIDNLMAIKENIPEELDVQSIYINGELKTQDTNIDDKETFVNSISNDLEYNVSVEPGETLNVSIRTKVRDTGDRTFEKKTLENLAKVYVEGIEKSRTSEITHTLKGDITDENRNVITGVAWLDQNGNGQKDVEEKRLSNINVKLFNISTNSIAKDKDGNIAETTTNENGEYTFTRIDDGQYIVLFEYDTTKYELTTYMQEGLIESQNSNAVLKTIEIDGEQKVCAVTDTIELVESKSNINIGLKEILNYDMELSKYISRIVVQNNNETKSYDYTDATFAKVEIKGKDLNSSLVILEYTIRVKNNGDVAGYITSIVDYLPNGLEFNSELNSDWYLSGENLYSKSLSNTVLNPGETRDIKLVLTKMMTEDNTGLVNNRAEIVESYNEFGKVDIDSTPNNLAKDEDDLGSADVIISISTGARTLVFSLLMILNVALIMFAIYLIFIKSRNKR